MFDCLFFLFCFEFFHIGYPCISYVCRGMTSNSIDVKYFDIEGEHHNQVTSCRSYLFHLTHVTHLVILFKRNKSSKSSIVVLCYTFLVFSSLAGFDQIFLRQNQFQKLVVVRYFGKS